MSDSGAFFRQVVESSRDGIWVFDAEGRTLYANRRTAELLGRTHAEMPGLSVSDVLDEVGRTQFAAHLEQLRAVGENRREVECSYLRADGTPVCVLVSEFALLDEEGRQHGYVHRLTPDEDRQDLLAELSRSRQQLDEAQALARLGSWHLDLVSGQLDWSRELFAIFGLDPRTHVPTEADFYERLLQPDRDRVAALVRSTLEGGSSFEFDARMQRNDGEVGWLRGLGRVTRADDGTPVRMQGTGQDLTSLKETELQLQDAVVVNTLMQVVADAANQAATLRDALAMTRELLLAHEDWQRAVAWSVVGDAGDPRLEPLRVDADEPEPPEVDRRTAQRTLADDGIVFDEETEPDAPRIGFPIRHGDGAAAVIVITARSPFERQAMLSTLVDQVGRQLAQVIERETAAAELARARDAAMEASRLKGEFLATMSHEIRTPMNGVIGLNELLLRSELDPRQRRLAEGVQTAGQSLLAVINNILDFSKIEAGELELESVAFSPRQVLSDVVSLLEGVAVDREVTVTAHLGHDVPELVTGDPGRLRQVLVNLTGNAVKFTRRGDVVLTVTRPRSAPAGTLAFEVRDTGVGMGAEQLERIFEPFRQADASTTRTHGGTGLGLTISRRLVTAMEGELTASSEPGRGSTFRFTAVLPAVEERPAGRTERPGPGGAAAGGAAHVLVVEDNQLNQIVTVGLLESLGYSSEVASDGEEAAAMVAQGNFDAVLMDLQMPRLDGYGATRRIRAAEDGTRLPVIALTASATEREREQCRAAGMDDFLTKPLQVDRLEDVLRSWVPTARPGPAAALASEAAGVDPELLDPLRLDQLEAMGDGATALVARVVESFVGGVAEVSDGLRAAVAQEDGELVRAQAHRLRGAALNLGAVRVADTSGELEELGAGGELTEAAAVVTRLEQELLETTAALAARRRRTSAP